MYRSAYFFAALYALLAIATCAFDWHI